MSFLLGFWIGLGLMWLWKKGRMSSLREAHRSTLVALRETRIQLFDSERECERLNRMLHGDTHTPDWWKQK